MFVINVLMKQQLLSALDKWSKDQSIERTELFAAFTESVLAAVTAFAMLESSHMQEPPGLIRTRDRIMTKLAQFVTAKDTRGQFAAIIVMLHDAVELLDQAVGVIDIEITERTENRYIEITERTENRYIEMPERTENRYIEMPERTEESRR
jgi:hypothetical protein